MHHILDQSTWQHKWYLPWNNLHCIRIELTTDAPDDVEDKPNDTEDAYNDTVGFAEVGINEIDKDACEDGDAATDY